MDKLKVLCCCVIVAEATLQQVHVLLRHGDRNSDAESLYPKDPHLNDTYYPDGLGALTMLGKKQEYNIGQTLRRKYNKFLGNIYTPDILEARSTALNRAKASLLLVLAGLWPPAQSQMWNPHLPWLPIPYDYYPFQNDTLLRFPVPNCPRYRDLYDLVEQLDKYQYWFIKNEDTIKYINDSSGLNITRAQDFVTLFVGLKAEEATGRQLPEWTKKVWPEFLEEALLMAYEIQTHNEELLKAIGGRMVEKVLDDAYALITGESVPKIFLYSAHEYNILHVLAALKVYKPHMPPYAAHIIFELHKIKGQYGFKIFYQDYTAADPHLLQLPNCDVFCPVEEYEELYKNIFVGDDPSC